MTGIDNFALWKAEPNPGAPVAVRLFCLVVTFSGICGTMLLFGYLFGIGFRYGFGG